MKHQSSAALLRNGAVADAIFLGSVLTMDPQRPRAQGLAVRAGRVMALGDAATMHTFAGPATEVYELGGACLMPGFHDAHLHLTGLGLALGQLDLSGASSFSEALRLITAHASSLATDAWVMGGGFALNTWGLGTIGEHEAALLETAVGGRPALLESQDLHSSWVSRRVLAAAGIGPETTVPTDGRIEFGESGIPTGLLAERARELVAAVVPAHGRQELRAAVLAAGDHLASLGVTTVHHMAAEPPAYFREMALAADADFPLRVWACLPQQHIEAAAELGIATGLGGEHFTIGGAKFFADGALGSKTALMLDPYQGGTSKGIAVDSAEILAERLPLAIAAGLTPVVHAIGDAATRAVVDAFSDVAASLKAAGLRPRLEHAQHMHQDDVKRAGALGLICSLQPIHLTFDVAGIKAVLPDRLERAYPTRSLATAGARLAFGSDAPVAAADVFAGLRAACRRAAATGERLNAAEAISPDQALAAYTTGAAYAIGREERSGMLREGFDADLVVLSHDPLVDLDGLQVMSTYKAGRSTFNASS